jgi:hypothetical protein
MNIPALDIDAIEAAFNLSSSYLKAAQISRLYRQAGDERTANLYLNAALQNLPREIKKDDVYS